MMSNPYQPPTTLSVVVRSKRPRSWLPWNWFGSRLEINDEEAADEDEEFDPRPRIISGLRLAFCLFLVVSGFVLGLVSLPLFTNAWGNTDGVGLLLLIFAGWSWTTGIGYMRTSFGKAAFIGLLVGLLIGGLPFVAIWVIIAMAALTGSW